MQSSSYPAPLILSRSVEVKFLIAWWLNCLHYNMESILVNIST